MKTTQEKQIQRNVAAFNSSMDPSADMDSDDSGSDQDEFQRACNCLRSCP